MSGARGGSQQFGIRLAIEGQQQVEAALRQVQDAATNTGAMIERAGDSTGRALVVIERGTQAAGTALQRMGADAAALSPILENTGGAVSRLVAALGSGAGLAGVLAAAGGAVTAAVVLYQNWDTVTRGVAGAYDYLTGRVRVTAEEVRRTNGLLTEFRRLAETDAERAQRGQVADRVSALDAAQTEERSAIGQVEALRRQVESGRAAAEAAAEQQRLARAAGLPQVLDLGDPVARQRAAEAELRVAEARLATAREAVRLNRGAIAALGENAGTVINPRLDPNNDPNLPLPPQFQEPPSGGGGGGGGGSAVRATERAMKDLQDGIEGAKDATRGLGMEMRDLASAGGAVGKTLAGAFEDLVVNGRDFGDVLRGVERDLLRIGTRALVLKPLEDALGRIAGNLFSTGGAAFDKGGIAGLLGSLLGSGGGAEMAGAGALKSLADVAMSVAVAHDGWNVGAPGASTRSVPMSLFAEAPRFHSGGMIGPDERPVIAQVGERILSRSETAAYNRGGAMHVHFHGVTDAASFRNSEAQIMTKLAMSLTRAGRKR